jgi:hypothetical protein
MPWPWLWKIIVGSGEQQSITSTESGAVPPDEAVACYVSVVEGPPVSISFLERKPFEEGLIIYPQQQPVFFPFAEQMWFATEADTFGKVSVLWLNLRPVSGPPTS